MYEAAAAGVNEANRTPLDLIVASLRGRNVAVEGQAPPVGILWTDPEREWESLLPTLRTRLPELLALGTYSPDTRTGPAIWLRCLVDRKLDAPGLPTDLAPILYLPGVRRSELRAGDACPRAVRPLVELLYRGAAWHHVNGKDYTLAAFLQAEAGLDIARDRSTLDALRGALTEVAATPLGQLRDRHLDAGDFSELIVDDFRRDFLRWIGDPDGTRARLGDAKWAALRQQCGDKLGFDPDGQLDVKAGFKLGEGSGPWGAVWERYAESPGAYPGVDQVLRRSRPAGELPFRPERWPDLNDEREKAVREQLAALPEHSVAEAQATVSKLEASHGERRQWVWSQLRQAPLAEVLKPLADLASTARSAIGGATPDDIADVYADTGWRADATARDALRMASGTDATLVANGVRHLLESWLRDTAVAFQAVAQDCGLPSDGEQPRVEAREGECLVFVDGLRYELGKDLAARLEGKGCEVEVRRRWAATPTVTGTAKPAVTPVADLVAGDALGPDFRPQIQLEGGAQPARPARAGELREAMKARGYQIVDGTLDLPLESGARGWLEIGRIDKYGHDHNRDAATFVGLVHGDLDRIALRIVQLLEAGWSSIRIITDHGWLWLPGGLPLVQLPKHLTESKWSRCAVVSGDANPDVPRHPWYWSEAEWFATPPGIACFSKRDEYAHGGLSVQECLIPDLRVTRGAASGGPTADIVSIAWLRMRCTARVKVGGGPAKADLRLRNASGPSVVAVVKEVEPDGMVSLLMSGDEHEHADLVLVIIDAEGCVLSQRTTRVGEDS